MAKAGNKHKAAGEGSLRKVEKVKNGKRYVYWEGRLTIGVDPGTGKQLQKTFSGKTQKEVKDKMQAAAVAVTNREYFEPGKLTVKQWFKMWLDEYCGDKKFLTIKQYSSMSETHIFPALGAVKLSTLSSPDIQKFYNRMAKEGKTIEKTDKATGKVITTKEPLSTKTIRNIHGIMHKALETAVEQKLISRNPADYVTVPKVEKVEVQPLTEEQQRAFLSAVQNHKFEYLFSVILFCGLREGEALGLTWDCIDFKKGTLKVYRQLQRRDVSEGGYIFAPLKNNKPRVITLSPFVVGILEKQRAKQVQERFAAGELWRGFQSEAERKTSFVFTDEVGQHLATATVYGNFKRIVKDIGAEKARVHDLRHTFAVNALQNGDDVKTVQDNLGHATAAFTLDVYGHVSERMKEESARRQEEYIQRLRAEKKA